MSTTPVPGSSARVASARARLEAATANRAEFRRLTARLDSLAGEIESARAESARLDESAARE